MKYMDGTFPWENLHDLAKVGILGMAVPEEYGGLGLPVLDTALVLEEVAKGCYVTAMALMGEVGVQARVISTYAPEAIKQRILPERLQRRIPAGGVHDRAACRHGRRQLPDQHRRRRQQGDSERHQDTDQPRRRGADVRGVHARQQDAGPRGHRLRADRARHARIPVHGPLPHHGRREPRGDHLRELRIAAGEPGASRRTASASC